MRIASGTLPPVFTLQVVASTALSSSELGGLPQERRVLDVACHRAELRVGLSVQPASFWEALVPDAALREAIPAEQFEVVKEACGLRLRNLSAGGTLVNGRIVRDFAVVEVLLSLLLLSLLIITIIIIFIIFIIIIIIIILIIIIIIIVVEGGDVIGIGAREGRCPALLLRLAALGDGEAPSWSSGGATVEDFVSFAPPHCVDFACEEEPLFDTAALLDASTTTSLLHSRGAGGSLGGSLRTDREVRTLRWETEESDTGAAPQCGHSSVCIVC